MDGHMVVMFIITVLMGTLVSKKLEDTVGIPLPLSLIAINVTGAFFIHYSINFGILMLTLLPLLLIPDSLLMKIKDLSNHWFSITYMAFISVILSVCVGMYITPYFLDGYPIVFFLVLYSITMATDAISVSAVFNKFPKVPHKIKFFAEAESLFNDATAVIIFTVVAIPMIMGVNVDLISDAIPGALKVIAISVSIGLVCGWVFSYLMSFFTETIDEFMIIPLIAYVSFYLAELMHVSGILAVIVSLVLFKNYVTQNIRIFTEGLEVTPSFIKLRNRVITTKEKLMQNEKIIEYISFIAVAILFASLGMSIHIADLLTAWKEILIVFGITTVIRFSMFMPMIATKTIEFKDSFILTFGGVKGGLAVLMVHMIPATFAYKADIEVLVFGQIVLSTFLYVAMLLILIPKFYKAEK